MNDYTTKTLLSWLSISIVVLVTTIIAVVGLPPALSLSFAGLLDRVVFVAIVNV